MGGARYRYPGVEHEFTMMQLQDLLDWIRFVIDADITASSASEDKLSHNCDGGSKSHDSSDEEDWDSESRVHAAESADRREGPRDRVMARADQKEANGGNFPTPAVVQAEAKPHSPSAGESLIPYDLEWLSGVAGRGSVRIIYTIPRTTASDINM